MNDQFKQDHYYAILKAIPDLMLLVKQDGSCLEIITPQAAGAGVFLPINQHIKEILPPDLLEQQLKAIASVLTTGKVEIYEQKLEKYGTICYEEVRISPVSEETVLILIRDITETKIAENTIKNTNLALEKAHQKLLQEKDERQQLETELEQIFNLSLDLICIAGIDGYFHKINPAFTQILGYSEQELLSKPFLDFVHPEDQKATINKLEKLANGSLCIKFHNRYRCHNGSYRWLSWNATPIIPEGLIYAVARDITEQKQIEQALQESEANNNAILNAIPDYIFRLNQEGIFLDFKSVSQNNLLVQSQDFLGAKIVDIMPPNLGKLLLEEIKQTLENQTIRSFEYELLISDETRYYEARFTAITENEVLAIVRDITEHKEAQQQLYQTEARLRYLLSASPAVLYSANFQPWKTTFISDNVTFVLGYPAPIFLENPNFLLQHIYSEDLPLILTALPHLVEQGYYSFKYRFLHGDGSYRWILDEGQLVQDEQGNPLEFVGSLIDITELQESQTALRLSEERLKLALEAVEEGVWDWNLTTGEIYRSPQWALMLGYNIEEIGNDLQTRDRLIHPDDFPTLKQELEAHLTRKTPYFSHVFRMKTKSGQWCWILDRGKVVARDEQGNPLRIIGTQKDITQRKQMEDALRKSEENFRLIVTYAPVGIFQTDLQGDYLFVNQRWQELTGLSYMEAVGQGWCQALHPLDRKTVLELWSNCITNQQQFSLEYRFQTPQGKVNWVTCRAIPVYNQEEILTGFFGTVTDITERKQAEKERTKFTQALSLKNNALERTKAQLAESNLSLERKVQERTQELSETLAILKATQAELLFENALLRNADHSSAFDYQVGGSLPLDAPTYVVRSADRYFYKALKQGQFCYILNTRQMGKSSLLVRMLYHLEQEGFCCAAIDLTLLGSDTATPEQWYKGLGVQLWQKFRLLDKINFKLWWSEQQDLTPVQRLSRFIEEVILVFAGVEGGLPAQNLVIFLDEIDSILGLNFPVNDFFALIRSCYNQRSLNSAYNRLTFALFGVATPSDLIDDLYRTPFNIGQAIHLSGFQLHEAQPLVQGLTGKFTNPQRVLQEVLDWTGGQPFLTQKLCQLINNSSSSIPANQEAEWIDNLVTTCIINNWETQDEPAHLKTIRDRILRGKIPSSYLLALYRQILLEGEVVAPGTTAENELILSGLVIKQEGLLKVHNRIYAEIFDLNWVERQLRLES